VSRSVSDSLLPFVSITTLITVIIIIIIIIIGSSNSNNVTISCHVTTLPIAEVHEH
jgi:hypothetical protein